MPTYPTKPPELRLRYAQVEELVAGMLDVHEQRRSALAARFRVFRGRGFPPNVGTGAKTRFAYDLDAVLRLCLAFQLLDASVPQEIAPLIIEREWGALKGAFATAFQRVVEDGNDAASSSHHRPMLVMRPRNLFSFTRPRDADDTNGFQATVAAADEIPNGWDRSDGPDRFGPIIIVDLQRLAGWVRNALLSSRWADPELFERYANS